MPSVRQIGLARRAQPVAFGSTLLCIVLALALLVAGVPELASAFGWAGLASFLVGVVLAGVATAAPDR